MRFERFISLALVLLISSACSQPEMPRSAAPQRDAQRLDQVQPPAPPPIPPREWSLRLRSSGGFASHGRGSISLNSEGWVTDVPRCDQMLAGEQRLAVENAIAVARPETWARRYEGKRRVTDAFSYSLSLTVDGKRYDTSWRSDELPDDLDALYKAVWAAREAYVATCRPSGAR